MLFEKVAGCYKIIKPQGQPPSSSFLQKLVVKSCRFQLFVLIQPFLPLLIALFRLGSPPRWLVHNDRSLLFPRHASLIPLLLESEFACHSWEVQWLFS